MGGISTHKSNEIPVFGIRGRIGHQVTDQSGIGMRRCGKTN